MCKIMTTAHLFVVLLGFGLGRRGLRRCRTHRIVCGHILQRLLGHEPVDPRTCARTLAEARMLVRTIVATRAATRFIRDVSYPRAR